MDFLTVDRVLPYLAAFIAAGATTLLLTPFVGKLAGHIGAIDKPEARKVHQEPIPRLGGLGIFFGFFVGLMVFLLFQPNEANLHLAAIIAGAMIIVIVGVLDDVKNLSPKYKFAGQFLAALIIVAFGPRIEFIGVPTGDVIYLNPVLSAGITIFWIVSLVNIINFIDGLDGLAAGVASIAALTLFVYAVVSGHGEGAFVALVLAASAIGFLRHNFNPATIFMGDSGSMLLGFVLGAVTVSGVTKGIAFVTLLVPLVIVAIPIFDTAFAIVRRLASGQPITAPDKGHIHHRLLHKGHSQRQTVIRIYIWSIVLSGVAIGLTLTSHSTRLAVIGLAIVLSFWFVHSLGLFDGLLTAFRERTTPPRARRDFGAPVDAQPDVIDGAAAIATTAVPKPNGNGSPGNGHGAVAMSSSATESPAGDEAPAPTTLPPV